MTPAKVTLPPAVRGDTWRGIPSLQVLVNGNPPVTTPVSARMHFKKDIRKATSLLSLSTQAGEGISIVNASNWIFLVSPRVLTIESGNYHADFEITDSAGTIWTPVQFSLHLAQDVTR